MLADRIRTEYDIRAIFEAMKISLARWVETDDRRLMKKFIDSNEAEIAEDHNNAPVYLARSQFILDRTQQEWPDIRFLKTVEQVQ